MSSVIHGRFAPTPSGRMHLGNVFCALIAWLSAKQQQGTMTLRIEDLDQSRCPKNNSKLLEDDLSWLGLDWDYGSKEKGEQTPYYQSQRFAIYDAYLKQLEQSSEVYPCFCSRADLHAAEAPHADDGRVIYNGMCRHLSEYDIAARIKKESFSLRLKMPNKLIMFNDGHYGKYEQNLQKECGDIILKRRDGVYAYQLAVVIDDALMGITEVVRGVDLLSSTPQQLYLYQLLGFKAPEFFHVPLLVTPDGRRLAKRDRDLDLGSLRQQKISPERIIGLLAHLAGLLKEPLPITAKELLKLFNWQKVPKKNIIINEDILKFLK